MATEDEILKTLRSIEKLIGGGAQTTGLGRAPQQPQGGPGTGLRFTRQQQNTAGGANNSNNQRSFQATSAALDKLEKSSTGLNKNFDGLSKTVYSTRANFVAMNRSMRAYATGQATANVTGGQQTPAAGTAPPQGNFVQRAIQNLFGRGAKPPGNKAPVEALGDGLADAGKGFGLASIGIMSFVKSVGSLIAPLAQDMVALQSAGINATSAIGGLYIDAAKAGMSLAQYTKLLDDSNAVVSRSTSMDDFNKKLTSSVDQLNGLGIFGAEATGLAAQLATSATTLGVSQTDLNRATDPLISIFGNLQKTVGMSVAGFSELEKTVLENENVQEAMVGMTKEQRVAALAQYVQTQALGRSLGGTKAQSDALAKSLLAQREVSVEDSFKGAGQVNQLGAVLGMNGADVRAFSDASMSPIPTGDEQKTLADVGGKIAASVNRVLNDRNNIQGRFAVQSILGSLPPNIRALIKASGDVKTTGDSGPNQAVNADFAHGASDLVKGAGEFLTAMEGFKANPIADKIVTALSSAAFSTSLGFAIGKVFMGGGGGAGGGLLSSLFSGGKKAAATEAAGASAFSSMATQLGAPTQAVASTASNLTKLASTAGKTLGILGTALTVVTTIGGAISDYQDADKREQTASAGDDAQGVNDAQQDKAVAKGEGIGAGIGTALGIAISGAVAVLTGGIGIFAAGVITSTTTALGAWLGHIWGKSNADDIKEQKANTQATAANTKAVADAAKAAAGETSEETLSSTDNISGQIMAQGMTVYDATSKRAADAKAKADAAAAKKAAADKETAATTLTADERDKLRAQADAEANPSGLAGSGDGFTGDAFGTGADARFEELVKQAQDAKKKAYQAQATATNAQQSVAAAPAGDASPAVATPAPSPVKTVTPPAVNTDDVAAAASSAATAAASANPANALPANPVPDSANQMAQIVKLLQDLLATEMVSRDGIASLASQALRPTFADSTSLAGMISKG